METYDLSTWEEFEARILELRNESRANGNPPLIGPLFRGQSDSSWSLITTLERDLPGRNSPISYYDLIHDIKPLIEKTNHQQFTIDSKEDFERWLHTRHTSTHEMFQADRYMVYLRQFGFPSPLLDWTQSPDIASYFAFSKQSRPKSCRVAVWALFKPSLKLENTFAENWKIMHIGHNFDAHKRHSKQLAEYTVCIEKNGNTFAYGKIESHTDDISLGHYILKKYTIPFSEQSRILRILNQRGVNEYEVYGTDESLLKSIAMREMYFPS